MTSYQQSKPKILNALIIKTESYQQFQHKFFIKISPINVNTVSEKNGLGTGIINGINLL